MFYIDKAEPTSGKEETELHVKAAMENKTFKSGEQASHLPSEFFFVRTTSEDSFVTESSLWLVFILKGQRGLLLSWAICFIVFIFAI